MLRAAWYWLAVGTTTITAAYPCPYQLLIAQGEQDSAAPGALHSAPEALRTAIQGDYRATIDSHWRGQGSPRSGNPAEALAKRLSEPYVQGLLSLGFRVVRGDRGETRVMPPDSLETIFQRSQERLQGMVRAGMSPEDTVEPALIFSRKVGEQKEFHFVRPGRDPWPDPNVWNYDGTPGQIPHTVFYGAVADGKMPFSFRGFLSHDLAHMTELLDSPVIMKGWRDYGRQLKRNPRLSSQDDTPGIPGVVFAEHSDSDLRSYALAEWLSVPDIQRANEVRGLFPRRPANVEAAKNWLKAQPPAERRALLEKVLEKGPELLLRHGGGLRDHYNMDVFLQPALVTNSVLNDFNRLSKTRPSLLSVTGENAQLPLETLHGRLKALALLMDLRHQPRSWREHFQRAPHGIAPDLARAFVETDAPKRAEILDSMIAETAARIEMAFTQAVDLGITADQLHRDARLQLPAASTPTHRYFRSYLSPTDLQYRAFVGTP